LHFNTDAVEKSYLGAAQNQQYQSLCGLFIYIVILSTPLLKIILLKTSYVHAENYFEVGEYCFACADILIGMPSTSAGNLLTKLATEHSRFLVAELNVRVSLLF